MEENAEVFAVDAEFSAEFLAVGFIEEETLEDAAVLLWQLGQDLADGGLALLIDEGGVEIDADIGEVRELGFSGSVFALAAERFEEDVFRNGVDEGREAFDFGASADVQDHAEEGLLTDVVNHLAGPETETETGLQHAREVRDEMPFGVWLLLFEAGQVVQIKRRLLHRSARWNYSTSGPGGRGTQS